MPSNDGLPEPLAERKTVTLFACDGCYIAIGMPAGAGGWQAP